MANIVALPEANATGDIETAVRRQNPPLMEKLSDADHGMCGMRTTRGMRNHQPDNVAPRSNTKVGHWRSKTRFPATRWGTEPAYLFANRLRQSSAVEGSEAFSDEIGCDNERDNRAGIEDDDPPGACAEKSIILRNRQSVDGGWIPRPRKLRVAMVKNAYPSRTTASIRMTSRILGRIANNIIDIELSPLNSAALT